MATTLQAITVGPQIMRLAGHPVDISPGAEASGRFSTTFAPLWQHTRIGKLRVSQFNPVCEVHFIQPRNALVVGSSIGKKNSMRISSRLTSRGVPSVAIVVNN